MDGRSSSLTAENEGGGGEAKKKKPKIGPASKVKRSPTPKETDNGQDTASKDTASKDTASKDTASRDTASKDTDSKDIKAKEVEAKENKVKDVESKDKEADRQSKDLTKSKDSSDRPKPKAGPASVMKKMKTASAEDGERDKKKKDDDSKDKEKKKENKEEKRDKPEKKEDKKSSTVSGVSSSFLENARKLLLDDSDLSMSDDDDDDDAKKGSKEAAAEKKEKAAPVKTKKKRSSIDTDDFLASDVDEEKAKTKKKKKLKDLIKGLSPTKSGKVSSGEGGGGADAPSGSKTSPQKRKVIAKGESGGLEGRVFEHDNTEGPTCFKCGVVCKDTANLKNHVLSHYYAIFYAVLPDSKPYNCPFPGCENPHRDKISLARHYAFSHRKLFEMTDVTPEQVQATGKKGRKTGPRMKKDTGEAGTPKVKKIKTVGSSSGGGSGGGGARLISKAFVDSSDDDDNDDDKEKSKKKESASVRPENCITANHAEDINKVSKEKKDDAAEKLKKKHKKKDKERDKDREHKHKHKDREKSKKHKKDKEKGGSGENPLLRLIADLKGSDSSSNEAKPAVTVGPSWDAGEQGDKKGTVLP